MTIGFPSVRIDDANPLHHLWCNNGTWWVHYTLHFDFRRRRIRRSLGTRSLDDAVRRRDELLARLARDGEPVPDRRAVRPAAGANAVAPGPASPAACATSV
ncbi:MAG: hypothetical protein ACKOSQ_08115 [Planctomycetaceae bacterium]